jgi:hypothetical protein
MGVASISCRTVTGVLFVRMRREAVIVMQVGLLGRYESSVVLALL